MAGVFFGFLVGWVIGAQREVPGTARTAATAASQGGAQPAQREPAAPLDEARVATLKTTAEKDPQDAPTRVLIGNLYFDAERFPEAIQWYQDALKIDPRNPNVSTDLGIAFYYTNQPDRALAQFDRSLQLDPKHTKTLLNIGIVRAFGKEDIEGAKQAWQKVLEVAPGTPEASMAQRALDGLKSHPATSGAAPAPRGQDR
jgi:cytochrome c-type biogenesis protein CcmH/NrfG